MPEFDWFLIDDFIEEQQQIQDLPAPKIPHEPTDRELYDEFKNSVRPHRGFIDKLVHGAGIADDEVAELEQLVSDWKRLKHGD